VRCGRRAITLGLGLEFEAERITAPSDVEPAPALLPVEPAEVLRITELAEDELAEEPRVPPRGAAGMTPVARGAGIGRGVCRLDALRVTRINDPGAGALDEPPLTTSLVDAERITGSEAVLSDSGLEDTGLDEIGLAGDRSTRANSAGDEVVVDMAGPPWAVTPRLWVWLGRLGEEERKERCTVATGARKVDAAAGIEGLVTEETCELLVGTADRRTDNRSAD
jgi:hypothetical protein